MGINLTTTSDLVRVVTDAATAVDVHASWVDVGSGGPVPGRTNTLISTATTTTVVGSPASSTFRTVKTLAIRNRGATLAVSVTVIHSDGSNIPEMIRTQLAPGDALHYDEHRGWSCRDALYGRDLAVADYVFTAPAVGEMRTVVLDRNVVNNCNTANTMMSIEGLRIPVVTGHRYWFRMVLMYTADATTTGARFSIFGDAVVVAVRAQMTSALTTTSKTSQDGIQAYDGPAAASATSASTGSNLAVVEGFLDDIEIDSTVVPRFASAIASAPITVLAGSRVMWQRVT